MSNFKESMEMLCAISFYAIDPACLTGKKSTDSLLAKKLRAEILAEYERTQARVAELEAALKYIDEQSLDARVIAKARAALEGKG